MSNAQVKSARSAEFVCKTYNTDEIRSRLEEACITLILIKDWRGVPKVVSDKWQKMQALIIKGRNIDEASLHLFEPNLESILQMWEAFSWLHPLLPSEANIVVLLSAGISTKGLAKYFGRLSYDIDAAFDRAIRQIEATLSQAEATNAAWIDEIRDAFTY